MCEQLKIQEEPYELKLKENLEEEGRVGCHIPIYNQPVVLPKKLEDSLLTIPKLKRKNKKLKKQLQALLESSDDESE